MDNPGLKKNIQHQLHQEGKAPPFHLHFHLHSKLPKRSSLNNGKMGASTAITNAFLESTHRETSRFIGKGGYGAVFEVRDKRTLQPKPEVLKVSYCSDIEQLDAFQKEVFYLSLLRNVDVPPIPGIPCERQTIVPNLIHSCVQPATHKPRHKSNAKHEEPSTMKHGIQVMDKLESNMTQLGLEQSRDYGLGEGSFAFTSHQLLTMIWLTLVLDDLGIVHGDFKPRNICQSNKGLIQKIIDLAFAGDSRYFDVKRQKHNLCLRPQLGYPSLRFRKKKDRKNPKNPPSFPKQLWKYLNRCQLYYSLIVKRKTYLIRETGKRCDLIPSWIILDHLNLPSIRAWQFLNLYEGLDTRKKLPLQNNNPLKAKR